MRILEETRRRPCINRRGVSMISEDLLVQVSSELSPEADKDPVMEGRGRDGHCRQRAKR